MVRAPLISGGGVVVVRDLISPPWFAALRDEAAALRRTATEQRKEASDTGGWRSGNPARCLAYAPGGEVQCRLYADAGLSRKLSEIAGRKINPTGDEGSYSYYDHPGHFLGLHRDIRTCDVTLIICLECKHGPEPSGALRLYPKAVRTPLEDITPDTPHHDLDMEPGDAVVLLGGVIPHEVLPAALGYRRHISVLCFQMAPA